MAESKKLLINGQERDVQIDSGTRLLSVLRDQLGLTGTKYGCGEGECGACTVLIDGVATRSCVTDAVKVVGKQIVTVEGLGTPDHLHPIQAAFRDHNAFQCGFCTAGMIMTTAGLLKEHPAATDDEIIEALNGNICRCGTYPRILAAVRDAARKTKEAGK